MPGKLNFISQKFRSNSVSQIDSHLNKTELCETPETDDLEMSDAETKNTWFKTWPERSYDKLDQANESSPEEENGLPNQFDRAESHIPLNKLLDKIPLAYSPITKQLHVLSPSKEQGILINKNYQSFNKPEALENGDEAEKLWKCSRDADDKKSELGTLMKPHQNEEERLCTLWNSKINHPGLKPQEYNQGKSDQCLLKTEASSFSSIVSSLSDNSPLNLDETTSGKLSLLDNDDLSIRSHCSHDSGSTCGENSKFFEERNSWNKGDNKRRGFSGFFSRNVFVWKTGVPLNSQGWKLFGKNSSHETEDSDSSHFSNAEADSQHSATDSPLSVKKYEDVVASSSALILHNRPANLPAKSVDEEQKHRLEYEQMVEAARKKELKESKKRKKQLQQQLKFEEQLASSSKIWNNDILPKWEGMKNSKKARELWWAGLPPSVRGKVWKLAIGNELNITYQLYEICVARALERLKAVEINPSDDCAGDADKESSVELIQLDISRTFPQLCIFQRGGPYYDILHCLLGAYVCYRPDVGYVQGMSFIAAILILNLEPADAFICFANLLNRPCHMAFFSLNQSLMQAYYDTYGDFFRENLPKLSNHFQESSLTPDLYLLDWVYSVFAKAMPLDIACRVWDVFLRDGEEFLFRTALGILHLYQDKLMKLDFINGAQFLTKLPEDLSPDLLFKSIDSIKLSIGKMKFSQVLAIHMEKRSPSVKNVLTCAGLVLIGFMDPPQNCRSSKFVQHAGAFIANLSAFAVGNILAWSSPASPLLLQGNAGYSVDEDENSLVGSVAAFGAAVSCLPAGYVSDKFGRKRTMLTLVPFLLLGWGLIIWSTTVKMIYAGRFILGLCSGIVCVTTPVFTVEICQKEIRGALGTYFQLLLSGGIMFTYVIGSQLDLFWLSLVSGIVPIIFGIAFIFFPETPVYFLMIGQPESARKSLKFFRSPDHDLESELVELTQYSNKSILNEESMCDVFVSKQGIKSLFMSVGMMIFQQLSGINAVIFYTTSIFEESGSALEPKYATIITGLVQFLTTFLAVSIVDRVGRVALLGTSALLMAVTTLILGIYFFLKEHNYEVKSFSWLPIVLLCVFLIVFSIGYGPIPWALIPEIIPSRIKSVINSLACVTNWISAFLVTKFFSDLSRAFGTGVTFWLFAGVSIVGTVFSFKVIPETKGKSFEEIQKELGED